MATYAVFVKALHNSSLTQRLAIYLALTHQVAYHSFYETLIEHGLRFHALTAGWFDQVSDHYANFLEDETASDHMRLESLPGAHLAVHPSRWLYGLTTWQMTAWQASIPSVGGR